MPSIAVIGASANRLKFGNKCVRAYLTQGWTVHPVNPRGGEIEGLPVTRSIAELPGSVDRVAWYLPAEVGIGVLEELTSLEHTEFFVNPGADPPAIIDRARELGLSPLQDCAIVAVGGDPSTL
jgi:predicted CoA-binding protein